MKLKSLDELADKFITTEQDAEREYHQLVIDEAFVGMTEAERNRRILAVDKAGRNVGNFVKDVEMARKQMEALRHLDTADAKKLEAEYRITKHNLEEFVREVRPKLEQEIKTLASRVSRAHNEASKARGDRQRAHACANEEARRHNRALADLVAERFREEKKDAK